MPGASPLMRYVPIASEDDVQIALVEHLRLRAMPGVVFYLIRNHGKRSVAAHRKDARMGLRKGASDLGFIIPPNGTAGLLELKVGKNKPTPEQEQFGREAVTAGAFHAVVWGLDDALRILTAWGVLKPDLN